MTDEKQKKIEAMRLLVFIYQEWPKEISDDSIAWWVENLRGVSFPDAWRAAKLLVREKSYGEPKFQDFWRCLVACTQRCSGLGAYNPHCASEPHYYSPYQLEGRRADEQEPLALPEVAKRLLLDTGKVQ